MRRSTKRSLYFCLPSHFQFYVGTPPCEVSVKIQEILSWIGCSLLTLACCSDRLEFPLKGCN